MLERAAFWKLHANKWVPGKHIHRPKMLEHARHRTSMAKGFSSVNHHQSPAGHALGTPLPYCTGGDTVLLGEHTAYHGMCQNRTK